MPETECGRGLFGGLCCSLVGLCRVGGNHLVGFVQNVFQERTCVFEPLLFGEGIVAENAVPPGVLCMPASGKVLFAPQVVKAEFDFGATLQAVADFINLAEEVASVYIFLDVVGIVEKWRASCESDLHGCTAFRFLFAMRACSIR